MILSLEDITVLRSLRDRGFAVCIFTPEEIGGADKDEVEDAMTEGGWRQINFDNTRKTK